MAENKQNKYKIKNLDNLDKEKEKETRINCQNDIIFASIFMAGNIKPQRKGLIIAHFLTQSCKDKKSLNTLSGSLISRIFVNFMHDRGGSMKINAKLYA